ncbi:MAG: asparagine synthase (glutamine-hydrolyzing) [Acidocella sp. 20-57-95]|nr:MAG: asparagine synthase (glutamine-hydrolyzing) [Acidocella sp. 20-57-95]HQT65027.1 asparagine synthase (glutamine-hydrolyzing) [Acidocella sp.]HQU03928.1 asparagine synthase (glutamine-hydrolyzing) [Acidocella sp.]
MCGIAGIMLAPGQVLDEALLARLTAALTHRGPDGAGEFIAADVALAHTRLAIIDLTTGDQPLFSGPLTLIANGEIYNFLEIKKELPLGYSTNSDCEPPLKLFARRSADYTKYLRGMYAIAIHDRAFRTLTLSRDPFGIKPLYIVQTEAGIAFASEPQALLAAGLAPRTIDHAKLAELLNLQFTTGKQTIFHNINRVLPGETITLKQGKIQAVHRIPAIAPAEIPPANETEALARLDEVLENAVDVHQRSDVPYGMFLSGGIDSSAILAMMARLNSSPVLAFTAGFDVPGVADERDAAAAAAKSVGAHHERLNITEKMVWQHLPEIVACMDDPVADYAIIPTWFLARRARQDVKVILSGEGGDEMFAGYGRYRAAARPFPFAKKMRAKGVFDGLDILRHASHHWRNGIATAEASIHDPSALKRAQRIDMQDWLPHDLLLKLDRCLMAHAIEGRTPFVDKDIAKFAFSLPERFLVRNGQGKYLLRLWLSKNLPAAQPFAKKQGFDVPIGAWIAAQGEALGALVAQNPLIAELAAPEKVRTLFANAHDKRAGFAAWVLLFTALWHRHHILNLPPAGDVFTTLRQL